MKRFAVILSLLLAPMMAQAEPLDAEAFDAYTRGKTLHYGNGAAPYGVERYMAGRRVIWSFLDGECQEGTWYEDEAGQICFIYENNLNPQCWSFRLGAEGLIARFENDPEDTLLYEAQDIGEEMICHGPKVGV